MDRMDEEGVSSFVGKRKIFQFSYSAECFGDNGQRGSQLPCHSKVLEVG